MSLYSISLICGFTIGIQHELIEDDNYIILSLGIIEIVFEWNN
jgi:hypothetical protein